MMLDIIILFIAYHFFITEVMSLLDLSGRVVAETMSFDEMEQFTSNYPLPPVGNGKLNSFILWLGFICLYLAAGLDK